ncbi:GGDEF domain-containing protein [Streptomyces seoulensis]|uniref:GGDEF domain-containing protein n=1 Tax=Streptomyces seoulensis TaxID=73044 RepID=UPI0033A15F95
MNELLTAVSAAGPLAAGWSMHGAWLRRRLSAARHDPLSGLWTRDTFEQRAARTLARCPQVAVMLLDLDGFKAMNDQHGHAAGDAAICSTAGALTEVLDGHRGAVAARLGGDEFAAVVPVSTPTALSWLLNGLHGAVTAPFWHDGRALTVGASIGAALSADPIVAGAATLPVLLRMADEAMYAVKQTGGGWNYPATTAPSLTSTSGRRTGRPGTHTPQHEKGAA